MRKRRRRKGSRLEDIVAARYSRAGYKVRKHVITKLGEIDILAKLKHEKRAVEVKSGKQTIAQTTIMKLHRKAKHLKAKPVLKIGPKVKLTKPAKTLAKELGITISRVRIKRKRK